MWHQAPPVWVLDALKEERIGGKHKTPGLEAEGTMGEFPELINTAESACVSTTHTHVFVV